MFDNKQYQKSLILFAEKKGLDKLNKNIYYFYPWICVLSFRKKKRSYDLFCIKCMALLNRVD